MYIARLSFVGKWREILCGTTFWGVVLLMSYTVPVFAFGTMCVFVLACARVCILFFRLVNLLFCLPRPLSPPPTSPNSLRVLPLSRWSLETGVRTSRLGPNQPEDWEKEREREREGRSSLWLALRLLEMLPSVRDHSAGCWRGNGSREAI